MLPTAPHGSLSACARALALILLAIIAAGSSLAQEVTPLEAARVLITEKQYKAAIEAVAPALASDDPTTVREAKLVVADCQRLLTRHDEAIASYTALVDEGLHDQTLVTALTGLADCLIRTGRPDEAERAIERALASPRDHRRRLRRPRKLLLPQRGPVLSRSSSRAGSSPGWRALRLRGHPPPRSSRTASSATSMPPTVTRRTSPSRAATCCASRARTSGRSRSISRRWTPAATAASRARRRSASIRFG